MSPDPKRNPWHTFDSQFKYQSPWIRVDEHQVIHPSGNSGIYGTVHFKNQAVVIIPVDQEQNTWLVGQYRYPLKEYTWEVPQGSGPINTDSLPIAKRELQEETGITAKRYDNIIQCTHLSNSVTDEVGTIWLARELSFGTPKPDESEELQLKKVNLQEAINMAHQGSITDLLTQCALFKLELMILKKEIQF